MERAIRFRMGGEERVVNGVAPTTTVLQWLRRHAGRPGTKEGCAEGDCGACTVVVLDDGPTGAPRVRPINACITFLPALDGKELLTVEDLSAPGGPLHPVQAAMVETHASQCGFCTPGFVMSLAALALSGERPDRAGLCDALAGNLCRCTGYGPILAAGERALAGPGLSDRLPRQPPGEPSQAPPNTAAADRSTFLYRVGEAVWFAPKSADDLAAIHRDNPDARLVGGMTDVGLWVTKQHRRLDRLIHVGDVADLRAIRLRGGWLVIDGMASLADLHRFVLATLSGDLRRELGELLRRFGSRQIREAGTVGGNIGNGSPIGDLAPAFIALGAELTLRRGQDRRSIALEDFFLGYGRQDRAPGEFIERIAVPLPEAATVVRIYKVSKRFDEDISAVCGAFAVARRGDVIGTARLAFGGMAATPKRARAAEATLAGQPWAAETFAAAAAALREDFTPISDMRASADYRMRVAANLIRRFWLEAGEALPAAATRLAALEPTA